MAKSNPYMNDPDEQRDVLDLFKRVASGVETIALAAPTGLPTAGAGSGVTGGPDLARIADDSISRLLGGAAGGKPEQFLARLKAVFPAQVKDGKTTYTYRATGSQPLDGPTGALVAGAQGAFYAQARALNGSINALLDQLVPVVTDPDQEEIDSLIASFKELTAGVVDEFGREGGAVVNRIDLARVRLDDTGQELLDKLGLGEAADANDAREMQLLQRNLIDENMAMLARLTKELTVDLLEDYKNKVVKGISAISPQLSWTFRAIPATLQQVRTQFDAVGIGLTDRMVREVERKNIKIEQALQWAEAAATSDFPRRLAAGRRADFEAIKDEANKLHKITKRLAGQFESEVGGGRLNAALKELRQHFKSIRKNAGKILAGPGAPNAGPPGAEPGGDGRDGDGPGGDRPRGPGSQGSDRLVFGESRSRETERKQIREFLTRGRGRAVSLQEVFGPDLLVEDSGPPDIEQMGVREDAEGRSDASKKAFKPAVLRKRSPGNKGVSVRKDVRAPGKAPGADNTASNQTESKQPDPESSGKLEEVLKQEALAEESSLPPVILEKIVEQVVSLDDGTAPDVAAKKASKPAVLAKKAPEKKGLSAREDVSAADKTLGEDSTASSQTDPKQPDPETQKGSGTETSGE